MSDETEHVDAGSETSGDQAATETTSASDTSKDEGAQDAGSAAEPSEESGSETSGAPDAEQSRTGFAEKGLHAGDECICPDGRKGTVHSFDAGLICIPNHDQSE